MTIDPYKEIRSMFERASLLHEATRHLNGADWAEYRNIQENHAAQVRFEERRFDIEYQTRFEVARKRIIDEGGAKDSKFIPRWFGSDKFDSAAVDRQAHRDVRRAHERVLKGLDDQRDVAVDRLLDACGRRQETREKVVIDFARATDRRAGKDRRRNPPR